MYPLLDAIAKLPPTAIRSDAVKEIAFEKAKELSNGRGIVNFGSGAYRQPFAHSVANSPEVVLNVDLIPSRVNNFYQWDLNKTPYPFEDRQFDVAFASHILEHLDNWPGALTEMKRIADHVVIALPHPYDIVAVLNPNHKHHFATDTIDALREDNVLIYC